MTAVAQISIQVNGQPKQLAATTNIAELLEVLEISNPAVAVEINASIVARDQFDAVRLQQGDVVEVVSLVGGG